MLEALYSNVHESQVTAGPNLILSNGDTLLSALTTPYPYISIEARDSRLLDSVGAVEAVDNMLITDLGMADEIENAVLNSYLNGVGILKIGYDSAFGWDPRHSLGVGKNALGMSLNQFDKGKNQIEFEGAQVGMPWVKSVDPMDFLVPWGTRHIDNGEWAAHRIIRHIDDVKSYSLYKNTKDLPPMLTMEDVMRGYNSKMMLNKLQASQFKYGGTDLRKPEYVEMWEIHDKRTQKVFVIAPGYPKFLREDPDYLQIYGLPFVGFGLVPSKRSFWRTSDAYYNLQAQLELTDITIQNTKLRRANVLKLLVKKGVLDIDQLNNITSSKVAAYVEVNGDPSSAISYLQAPPNVQNYQEAQAIRTNSREMIGLSRNEMGEFEPGGRRTAYEVSRVAQGSDTRQNRRQGIIGDTYTELFCKINAICGKFWTTPRLVQVMGPDNQEMWKAVTGNDLQGEFALRVEFSNEGPRNRQTQKQEALQLIPFFLQDPVADPAEVRKYIMRSLNDPNINRIYSKAQQGGGLNSPLQLPVQGPTAPFSGGPTPG